MVYIIHQHTRNQGRNVSFVDNMCQTVNSRKDMTSVLTADRNSDLEQLTFKETAMRTLASSRHALRVRLPAAGNERHEMLNETDDEERSVRGPHFQDDRAVLARREMRVVTRDEKKKKKHAPAWRARPMRRKPQKRVPPENLNQHCYVSGQVVRAAPTSLIVLCLTNP